MVEDAVFFMENLETGTLRQSLGLAGAATATAKVTAATATVKQQNEVTK
jgi:hypothetical protein